MFNAGGTYLAVAPLVSTVMMWLGVILCAASIAALIAWYVWRKPDYWFWLSKFSEDDEKGDRPQRKKGRK